MKMKWGRRTSGYGFNAPFLSSCNRVWNFAKQFIQIHGWQLLCAVEYVYITIMPWLHYRIYLQILGFCFDSLRLRHNYMPVKVENKLVVECICIATLQLTVGTNPLNPKEMLSLTLHRFFFKKKPILPHARDIKTGDRDEASVVQGKLILPMISAGKYLCKTLMVI